jgi:squalene-associated FAD-dependent desaturase
MTRVAVIGGGLTALSCALSLAEHGITCELFEAAPQLGGRTRSFHDPAIDAWVDNGPHLLIGAYTHARAFFARHGVTDLAWQPQLKLPLWDERRGHFCLSPRRGLPLPVSLAWAAARMPGHGIGTMLAIRRLGLAMRRPLPADLSTADWLQALRIPAPLQRDLLAPLCLGAMNEAIASAPAASFARVLREGFANHETARLGWFTRPFAQALVAPLERSLGQHGVQVHRHSRVVSLAAHHRSPGITLRSGPVMHFDRIVLALPGHERNRLLGIPGQAVETRPIANVHLWFDEELRLPQPLVGGIGTLGQWFFDIAQQMPGERHRHFCAVISDAATTSPIQQGERLIAELSRMLGRHRLRPRHMRVVHERRATVLVRPSPALALPPFVLDAGEHPQPGELPATIEAAVIRGLQAAEAILSTAT